MDHCRSIIQGKERLQYRSSQNLYDLFNRIQAKNMILSDILQKYDIYVYILLYYYLLLFCNFILVYRNNK